MGDSDELIGGWLGGGRGLLLGRCGTWCLAVRASDTRITPAPLGDFAGACDGFESGPLHPYELLSMR